MLRLAVLSIAVACAGCTHEAADPAAASAVATTAASGVDPAVAQSEQRLEQLVEVVRTLRDSDPQSFYPSRDTLQAALRSHPAGPDLLNDGWGRPFVYAVRGDGHGYRIYSLGPNGQDNNGTLDDAPMRSGEVTIK